MKKNLIFFTKLLFLAIVIKYLFDNNFINLKLFTKLNFNFINLISILFLIFLSIVAAALRWIIILRLMNFNIEIKKIFEITYISCFFNSIFLGGFGGDFVRAYYIYKSSNKNNLKLSFSVIIDRVIGFIGLFLIILYFSKNFLIGNLNVYTNQIFVIIITSIILILFVSFLFRKKLLIYFKKIVDNKLIDIVIKNFLKLVFTILLSIILFLAVNLSMYIISSDVYNYNINLNTIFFSNSVSIIFNTLSFTPGGIGIGEVIFSKIIEFLSNQNLEGIANIYIFWRVVYLIFCLPALILFLLYKNKIYKFKKN